MVVGCLSRKEHMVCSECIQIYGGIKNQLKWEKFMKGWFCLNEEFYTAHFYRAAYLL